jgi:hypothetical protein
MRNSKSLRRFEPSGRTTVKVKNNKVITDTNTNTVGLLKAAPTLDSNCQERLVQTETFLKTRKWASIGWQKFNNR